jgi:hypothetical protein
VLRAAVARLRVGLVLQQAGLALLLFLLGVAWLRLPDGSAADVIGTILLGLLLIAIAGVGESWLVLHLSGLTPTRGRLLRGTLFLMAGAALWLIWSALLNHLHGSNLLSAGYLNSRIPRPLRSIFSFQHIALWLFWMWATLHWIGSGVIVALVFIATVSSRPASTMRGALRCLSYWIVLVFGSICAIVLSGSLLQWTPGHGLGIEMVSMALRLGATLLVNATLLSLLLTILAVCVGRSDAAYSAPGGTPAESHPRTVEGP